MFQMITGVGIPVLLLFIGWLAGRAAERRHLQSLIMREQRFEDFLVSDIKTFPGGVADDTTPNFVMAECVIATDYLKSFLAAIRRILGGELGSYRSLMERARREALLRAMEQARERDCDAICNVRINTSTVAGARRKKSAMVEVYVSGTAYRRPEGSCHDQTPA